MTPNRQPKPKPTFMILSRKLCASVLAGWILFSPASAADSSSTTSPLPASFPPATHGRSESLSGLALSRLEKDSLGRVQISGSPGAGITFISGDFPVSLLDTRPYVGSTPFRSASSDASGLTAVEAHASTIALAFVDRYGALFDVRRPVEELVIRKAVIDELGMGHITLGQVHKGVEVYQSGVKVHVSSDGKTVRAASNEFDPAARVAPTEPEIGSAEAVAAAQELLPAGEVVGDSRLVIYATENERRELVWLVEMKAPALAERNIYVVDAMSGAVIDVISLIREAKSRAIYDAELKSVLPGTLARVEGQGSAANWEVNNAYFHIGATYDYFWNNHLWDFGSGTMRGSNSGKMIGSVRYREKADEPFKGAMWDGERMIFGEGNATSDITAHELGHALTQHTAALMYIHEIGAVNESYSDIWGHMLDSADWEIGEGSGVGALRDMSNPPRFGDPAHTDNYLYTCEDCGGVHTNSGIPNKAFYLISTNASVGKSKAARIYFRTLQHYLTEKSGFRDLRFKLAQAGQDLYGCATGEVQTIRNSFNSVGVTPTWRATSVCYKKNCMCAATVMTSDSSLFSSPLAAIRMASTLYQTRDTLLVGVRKYYRDLFYENTGDLAAIFVRNGEVRGRAAQLLTQMMPGLTALVEGKASDVVVPAEVTHAAVALFDEIARQDRRIGDGRLASVIERETARIDVTRLAGLTYEKAWERFYAPGERVGEHPGRYGQQ